MYILNIKFERLGKVKTGEAEALEERLERHQKQKKKKQNREEKLSIVKEDERTNSEKHELKGLKRNQQK